MMSGDLSKLTGLRVNAEQHEGPGLPAQSSPLLLALAPALQQSWLNVKNVLNPVYLIGAFVLQKWRQC